MKHQDTLTATRDIDPAEARTTDAASAAVSAVEPRSGGEARERDRTRRMRARHGPVKILFFAASTADGEPLALGDEFRAIKQAIRVARHRDALELIPVLATRRRDVHEALLEHSPEVVHFACHGSSKAEILLRGDGPGAEPMTAESLRLLFGVLRDNLVLVVFNACYASAQAAAIREVAGLAIGMRERVEDTAATAFAAALYGALASGRSVHDALEVGKAAMDERQGRLPELFARSGVDSHAVYLARAPRRRIGLAVVAGAVACGALIAAGVALAGRKASRPRPVSGMAQFAATEIHPGVFRADRRPASCSTLTAREDCAELVHPERVASVHVAAFDLDVAEVSNRDFAAWLNADPDLWTTDPHGRILTRQGVQLALTSPDCFGALAITSGPRVVTAPDKARWPAVCVTWYGAAAYCGAQHKRLPRAVEWELAAKGADGRPFPWGDVGPEPDGVAYGQRGGASAHPVDVQSSRGDISPEGVHDLGGNVAEWVGDERDTAESRTIRGGSWGSVGPCHLLGSGCKRVPANDYANDVGFRCASSAMDEL